MKRYFLLLVIVLTSAIRAEAQMYPVKTPQKSAVTIPASQQRSYIPTAPAAQQQPTATKPNAEAEGYSVAFLAKHYNQKCGLGLSDGIINILAGELKKAESANQISNATINENVGIAQKLYQENPKKFCADAAQIASVIRQIYPGF